MLKSLFLSTADPGSGNFSRTELLALSDKLPEALREPTARYLRTAPLIFAWMESTRDLLEDRFGVPGGSAIYSDGTYYWRLDTADYVETYGIDMPVEFLEHSKSRDWQPPEFEGAKVLELHEELTQIMREIATRSGTDNPLKIFHPSSWNPDDPRRHPQPRPSD